MHRMPRTTVMSYQGTEPKFGKDIFIADGACLIGDVELGDGVNIWFNAVLRGDVNYIKIGARTNIQDNSMVHVTDGGNPTIIGEDVTIGHSVVLHACTLKDRVLIGMGATILDKAVIGEDSIVGANSLVTSGKEFPPRSLIMGSPAKVVRTLTDDEVRSLKVSADHYLEIVANYL